MSKHEELIRRIEDRGSILADADDAETINSILIELGGKPIAVNQSYPGAGDGSRIIDVQAYTTLLMIRCINKLTRTTKLNFKKLDPKAKLPTYATDGAACFDFYALSDDLTTLYDHDAHIFRTGLSVEIPEGYALIIYSRSGHGFKHDTRLANCVGVIDSDYRGEIKVKLTYDSYESVDILPGDRIAQGMLIPAPQVEICEVEELSDTVRGNGGFGSTGR